ncbi:MAG: leucine--tRNA ligase [Candidatus Micrarchaeaceae archaeon]
MINYGAIESKWQKRWAEAGIYEPEPSDKKPLLVTAAWPYVNMPLHMGHLKTYSVADMYARYMRLRGFNVLYPMGFHYTGTPILAIAKRIKERNKDILDEIKIYHIPESELDKLSDPIYMANYFAEDAMNGMKKAGLGIDWRRTFTSINPLFSKMVEWQFYKMIEMGLLVTGTHPVAWCTNEGNAVGQHDTKGDVHPEIEEIPLIAFKEKGGETSFLCATYRPETIYGVANIFIAEGAAYVKIDINGKKYYVSKEAARQLSYQMKIGVEAEIPATELLKKEAINPLTGEAVPVLTGFFVKDSFGTGVVMSVPAHAPFDYAALKKLESKGIKVPTEYRKVISVEGEDGNKLPVEVSLSLIGADAFASDDILEKVTKQLYSLESHKGKMAYGKYSGIGEIEARDLITKELYSSGNAIKFYIISNQPVFCRCGTKAIVKIIDDQWFINYGDPAWKKKTKELFSGTIILPEKMRSAYEYTLGWLDLRAVERAQGLGTKFPLNREHIIESLSDSTLYMAFYTISHLLNAAKLSPENAKPEFFDYVFLGKGSIDSTAAATGIDPSLLKKCRESFLYWYSNTSRHSASELIYSHLTMYLFAHAGIMPKEFFPKLIITNGMQLYEGAKMSKSLGNIVPIFDAVEKYGADNLRAIEIAGADIDTDTDFSVSAVVGLQTRNEFLMSTINSMKDMQSGGLRPIDYWLYSKLNSKIKLCSKALESMSVKVAFGLIYYDSVNEIKRYLERGNPNQIVLSEFISKITIMLSPFMPHISEEFWEAMGNDGFVAKQDWPPVNESMINISTEKCEEVVDSTVSDIRNILEAISQKNPGKKPAKVLVIVADEWKFKARDILFETKKYQEAISKSDIIAAPKEEISKYVRQYKNPNSISGKLEYTAQELLEAFKDASEYISSKIGCKVDILAEASSGSSRSSRAMPEKPGIEVIWGGP